MISRTLSNGEKFILILIEMFLIPSYQLVKAGNLKRLFYASWNVLSVDPFGNEFLLVT